MSASAGRLALLPVLLGLSIAWVAPARATGQEGPEGAVANVIVQNHAGLDARVYVLQKGHMVPIGLVSPAEGATLTIPPTFVRSGEGIQLVADLVGSTDWYASDPVSVRPDDHVDFIVASAIDRSRVTVRG